MVEGFIAAVALASTQTASIGRSIVRCDRIDLDVEGRLAEAMLNCPHNCNYECDRSCTVVRMVSM